MRLSVCRPTSCRAARRVAKAESSDQEPCEPEIKPICRDDLEVSLHFELGVYLGGHS